MKLILDTGALIALERNDRRMWRLITPARGIDMPAVTHGGVVGQAWRKGGPRQALLAKALAGIVVRPLDAVLGLASLWTPGVVWAAIAVGIAGGVVNLALRRLAPQRATA